VTAELILFTPGPVRIPPKVAHALMNPPCNYHRQSAFSSMFAETEHELKALLGIRELGAYYATVMTTTGTGANEACLLALEGTGKGLILENGFFGARAVDQARQNHLDVEVLSSDSNQPIDVAAVAAKLDADPSIRWVFFVSHETRAGLMNPLEALGRACKDRGRFVAVDVISSAYAYPIDLEASKVDLATASSAKAIQAAPGLGIVITRKAAVDEIKAARAARGQKGGSQPKGYYFDVFAEYEKQAKESQPRFAQPVALHAALHAAATHLRETGIDLHYARIQRQMKMLIDHLATMGIKPMLEQARSNIAVNFRLPSKLTYSDFAKLMEQRGFFCLYGIPGDQSHFQLSTIGDLTDDHVKGVMNALSDVLR
jgi:2-aminoethylphosphonate-pyruvate transaminase